MSSQKTVVVICGPTAAGKTDFAIALAKVLQTEIISADSRQCYRELNIGVAKPSEKELNEVPHHFINSHSIFDEVNAAAYEDYALKAVFRIFEKHDFAVMTGGTGLYVNAFIHGMDKIPDTDPMIEAIIRDGYQQKGIEWLQSELKTRDVRFFAEGEIQNPQRGMRALAVAMSTGKSILDFQKGNSTQRDFQVKKILIDLPRAELYQRINQRVDIMMASGLLKEAEGLYQYKHLNALQTVGYRELFDFMNGKISLNRAIELIKQNTRHYAKRQMTWFRKYFL